MFYNSGIEINYQALENNLHFLRQQMDSKVKISSVVKGNAYGHGAIPFVTMALRAGIDHFSVFSAEEASQIYSIIEATQATVMIMGMLDESAIEWAIMHGIEYYIFDRHRLEQSIRMAKKIKIKARIHLEIETGMNRTGLTLNEIEPLVELINKNKEHVHVVGLCTHFAGAESITNYYRIKNQLQKFQKAKLLFKKLGLHPEIYHSACSAASVMYPQSQMDLVRIGIMQFGLWPSPETYINYKQKNQLKTDPLKRVISWKSRIMTIKSVQAGEFVGYGTSYLAAEDMQIAIVPVGYSTGYGRALSNLGQVLINEHYCAVIGTVNMNMIAVDVSGIPSAQPDQEVVLIGEQGKKAVTVSSFSENSNQLNYELLTRLPQNIERKIIH